MLEHPDEGSSPVGQKGIRDTNTSQLCAVDDRMVRGADTSSCFCLSSEFAMPSALIRSAVVVLKDEKGQCLFLRRSVSCPKYPLHWGLPGGYIEEGESYASGALREMKEETGLVLPRGFLSLRSASRTPKGVCLLFEADIKKFRPTMTDGEHDLFTWAAVEAPPYPTVPGLKGLLT